MAEPQSPLAIGPITNKSVVEGALSHLNVNYDVPQLDLRAQMVGVSLLSVPFYGDDEKLSFVVFIFIHESESLLRAYAHIYTINENSNIGKLFRLINDINHSYLLDASIDYSAEGRSVRLKANLRGYDDGLSARTVSVQLTNFFRVASDISLLIRSTMGSSSDFELAYDEGKLALKKKTGWMGTSFM